MRNPPPLSLDDQFIVKKLYTSSESAITKDFVEAAFDAERLDVLSIIAARFPKTRAHLEALLAEAAGLPAATFQSAAEAAAASLTAATGEEVRGLDDETAAASPEMNTLRLILLQLKNPTQLIIHHNGYDALHYALGLKNADLAIALLQEMPALFQDRSEKSRALFQDRSEKSRALFQDRREDFETLLRIWKDKTPTYCNTFDMFEDPEYWRLANAMQEAKLEHILPREEEAPSELDLIQLAEDLRDKGFFSLLRRSPDIDAPQRVKHTSNTLTQPDVVPSDKFKQLKQYFLYLSSKSPAELSALTPIYAAYLKMREAIDEEKDPEKVALIFNAPQVSRHFHIIAKYINAVIIPTKITDDDLRNASNTNPIVSITALKK